jgi:hypothetical protein
MTDATASLPAVAGLVASCPLLALGTIEVLFVDEAGTGLPGIVVELHNVHDARLGGETDSSGTVRFAGLAAGRYQVVPVELDREAWDVESTVPLAPERNRAPFPATWETRQPVAPAAAFTHVVVQGECTSSIACRYGFFVDTIWGHSRNLALKNQRRDRNVLAPRDRLFIPARNAGRCDGVPGNRYVLRRHGIPEHFHVRLLDGGAPRAGLPYLAIMTGHSADQIPSASGETDAQGAVHIDVPADVSTIELLVRAGSEEERYLFAIGTLDPASTVTGLKTRLANLGYYQGRIDGQQDAALAGAIRAFQRDNGLKETGQQDSKLEQALQKRSRF